MTPHRVQPEVSSSQQYAVVLVNEEQLDQLMGRPATRRVNARYGPQDVYARYERLKRRTVLTVVLLLVLAAGAVFWFVPRQTLASMFRWSTPPAIPTLYTGASFSVMIASLDSADGASAAATQVRGLGLPAFTRRSPGKQQAYQAMVGPYASLEEAESAQRRLGGMGYRGARLFVDESLRGAPRGEGRVQTGLTNPAVALLAAPERLTLVLELQSEPRQVKSSRATTSTLVIDAGPISTPAQPQQWSAPEGVHLLRTVSIAGVDASNGQHYVRTRVALPEFARANVRSEGRRVYVDITWPLEDGDRAPRQMAKQGVDESAGPELASSVRRSEQYRQAIDPVYQRIGEVKPFLLSAAQSGSVEVLAALDQTLVDLEATLTDMSVPVSEAGSHQLLLSATRVARQGLEPGFTGDRLAHARRAISMFEGAMAPSTNPEAQ